LRGSFATYFENYLLRFSVIFDPAITITITNDETRLINYKLAPIGDEVWFDDKALLIQGYRTMILKMGNQTILLKNVAYCSRLLTILVALRKLRKKGIYCNNQKNPTSLYKSNYTLICSFKDIYGQYVLKHIFQALSKASFSTIRHKFISWTKKAPKTGTAQRWHMRMGHPESSALEHLIKAFKGIKIRGPITV
jgi:hypothetical protein